MRNLYTFTTLLLGHKILNDGSRKAYYVCTHKIWLSLLHKLIRFVEYATLATKYYVAIIDTNPAHNSLLTEDFSELYCQSNGRSTKQQTRNQSGVRQS